MQSDAGQQLRDLVRSLSQESRSQISAKTLASVVQEEIEPEAEGEAGDLAKLQSELDGYRSEYQKSKAEINGKVAHSLDLGPWPSDRQYLLNRIESLLPELAQWMARMQSLSANAGKSKGARKKLAANLKAYSEGGDGRKLLEMTRVAVNSVESEMIQADQLLIATERDDLGKIVKADESYFQDYLKQGKPPISVYRGDGRGVNQNTLNGYVFTGVQAGGTPDISFFGVVQHTHSSTYKNGMVSTTPSLQQAIDWAVDDHPYGLVFEIRPANYIDVAFLLGARNYKNRFAAQLEILIPGSLAASEIAAVSLYQQAGKALVQRIQQ